MNKDIIKGNWNMLKGKVKQTWGKFTDDDMTTLKGGYDELEGLLQKRYGYQKEQAQKEIEKFVKTSGIKEKV